MMNEPMTLMECVQLTDDLVVWRNTTTYPDGRVEVEYWNESRAEYDMRAAWLDGLDWKEYNLDDPR